MEEEIKTLPTEQPEAELPAPSFWEKLKANKRNILAGVLGIFVFAGAVFGAYKLGQRHVQPIPQPTLTPEVAATPTPDPTVNWETYTNTEVGFSFKYPQTLAPSECKDGLHLFEATSELEASEFCEAPPFGKISLDYATIPFSPGYSQSLDFETKEEQITIGGVEATRQIVKKVKEAPGPDYAVFVIFSKDNYYFLVSLREKQYEPTFNLMLSTFRFLEEYIQSPNPKECTVDDDCQLERFRAGVCCPLICGDLWEGTVINKQEADRREGWRTRNCQRPMCPLAECKPPDYTFEVKCENKTCVAIKKVIKESD